MDFAAAFPWACVTDPDVEAFGQHGREWCEKFADGTNESMFPQLFIQSKRGPDDQIETRVFGIVTDFNEAADARTYPASNHQPTVNQ